MQALARRGKLTAHIQAFIGRVEAHFHQPVILYCNDGLYAHLRERMPTTQFWVAHYCCGSAFASNGHCFKTYDELASSINQPSARSGPVIGWQFTDAARVAGITGRVDMSIIPQHFWAAAAGRVSRVDSARSSTVNYRDDTQIREILFSCE